MRPCCTCEVEHQVYFIPAIKVPFLVRNIFKPVEVSHGSIVKKYIYPAKTAQRKIDQCLAVGRLIQFAGLQGNHRSTRGLNSINSSLCGFNLCIATDDQGALACEC